MMSLDPLFTPFKIRNITLRNRLTMSPMQKHRPADLIPGPEQVEYYEQRMKGGLGLIVTQGTTMDHPTSEAPYARLFPPAYDSWKRCTEAVRENGGHIFMQLWHEGAQREGGWGPSGRSASGKETGKTLSDQQIREIIDTYAFSAAKCKELGFSGIELHCGHGYLMGQFIGPLSNVRDDDWGGDFNRRMRFPLEITRAVRKAVGDDFVVGLRTSLWGGLDGSPKSFNTPDELAEYLMMFQRAGVDIFHALTDKFWRPEFEDVNDLAYAGWIKKLTGCPSIAGGSVGLDATLMESMGGKTANSIGGQGFGELMRRFNRGDFDLVSLGRAILTDPEWVNKVREGRFQDLRQSLTPADIFSGPLAKSQGVGG